MDGDRLLPYLLAELMDADEKFKLDVEYRIERHARRLDLDDSHAELAKSCYRSYHSSEQAYSRPDSVFALAALYLAQKVQDEPTTVADLVSETTFEETPVYRVAKEMQRIVASDYGGQLQQTDATAFIERYANTLDVPAETAAKAKAILERTELTIQNCPSSTKAAASLYLADHYTETNLQLVDIAAEADVTGQTISKRAREQKAVLSDEFLWGRSEAD